MFSEAEVGYFGLNLQNTSAERLQKKKKKKKKHLEDEREWREAIAKTSNTRLGEDQKKIVTTKVTSHEYSSTPLLNNLLHKLSISCKALRQ